ncbi:hypothetical protein PIGHUM_04102 [Pigmentiphaga humi]|uniref:Xcc1710-like domain-containing protein n=1 Tax=Pigmentiphaga humi TaxID=2478468 RepID=A0A3P4B8H9_9BURK|nr:Mth938-like domain-containing protein [Pigmentiphaga humi]VCU72008.1 hypothetical protein PIGHUM_04102 [Pigmentiphaga humi]
MKLHSDPASALNTITAYGDGYLEVNRVRYEHALVFAPEGDVVAWPVSTFEDIDAAALESVVPRAAAQPPEVVLIGTGARQRFLPPAVVKPLLKAGIGVEMMDTLAASRTYNILMAEGRRVIAALVPA